MESPVLVAELGSGGMAEVFLAIRRGMGGFVKLVVVKRLRTSMMESDAVAMFHDEARISARLNHPNVVQTHEVGFDGEHYCLEMEYLDGQPLHRITHRAKHAGRAISHGVAVAVIQDVLAGLHYAHELRDYDGSSLGIVHRDVSPQNIFVTYDGRVKLVDFGIAKASGQMAVTQFGMVKGKTRYMAPEQATGQPLDARADVFATGVVLWQLLVGRGYWGDADDVAIFSRITNVRLPPSPRSQNPEIPEALDAVVMRALAYDPAHRWASAEEFRQALEACGVAERGAQASLGAIAAELFADEREKIRGDIEKATARPIDEVTAIQPAPLALSDLASISNDRTLTRSERPVSGAVRRAERSSRWSVFGVAGAAALGAALAVATMKAITGQPAANTAGAEEPRPPVSLVASEAPPVAQAPPAAAPPISSAAASQSVATTSSPPRPGASAATQKQGNKSGSVTSAEVVVDAGATIAQPASTRISIHELVIDPWDSGVSH